MLFNSLHYIIFTIILFAIYTKLNPKYRKIILLLASFYFISVWNTLNIFLLLFNSSLDYFIGCSIDKSQNPKKRKILILTSIILNLGLLVFFKYYNFFVNNFTGILNIFGVNIYLPYSDILLPIGISFYTFQTMCYSIDIYRRKIPAVRSITDYFLYVMFYPQLVAGPIMRPDQLLPQINNIHHTDLTKINYDYYFCILMRGFAKKVLVADNLSIFVDKMFILNPQIDAFQTIIGVICFAFQIYCDFSGYCDIALGTAGMLGINLTVNFNFPYCSQSITEFWHRWHISLSQWLRDYLYIPLGGSKKGTAKTYSNLFITMFLAGLWHGANWNFILWGVFIGIFLIIERLFKNSNFLFFKLPSIIKVTYCFIVINISWILFRGNSFSLIIDIFKRIIFNWQNINFQNFTSAHKYLAVCVFIYFIHYSDFKLDLPRRFAKLNIFLQTFCYTILIGIIAYAYKQQNAFIYFRF
ncbi:MAG TPA: MBOAT family O-acyltransferase [bacterium]|nr:MBOAT family O-acyltransferase [bacterium]